MAVAWQSAASPHRAASAHGDNGRSGPHLEMGMSDEVAAAGCGK
jgi:hypothetical protein